MYLSRLELRPDASSKPEFWVDLQNLYREHQAIWQLFGDDPQRKRDFLFRKEVGADGSRWYTLSAREPIDGRGIWSVKSKGFEPILEAGQRLRFAVRVNPTVAKAGSKAKSVRHDVVMNEKRRMLEGKHSESESAIVHRACTAWLSARSAKHGFVFAPREVGFDGYRQLGGSKEAAIRISTVDINGILTVQEPEAFRKMLFQGLGPAKSFGCGLMLVRPV